MYDELKDISYIFYINSNSGNLHICNICDKEEVDDKGYLRYRAQYENCLTKSEDNRQAISNEGRNI